MKITQVAFINESLKKSYLELKEGKFEDQQLYNFIDRALDDMKKDPASGTKISKKLWPKDYIQNMELLICGNMIYPMLGD